MGGYGSGGGGYYSKNTVEDGLSFSLNTIAKHGISPRSGVLRWFIGDEETGSMGYEILYLNDSLFLKLKYRSDGISVEERIKLASTPQPFGNARWWMLCPILVNGSTCNQRCYKLYSTPGQRYFGCRKCMNLTYQSCKDSHKFDGLYARIAADMNLPAWVVKGAMKS